MGQPADGQPAAVQAAFAVLRARFIEGLPARWKEIDTAPPGPLRQAALHRLAGAAGSYGLNALGEAAHLAETVAPQAPVAELDEALAQLRRQIEAAGVTLP